MGQFRFISVMVMTDIAVQLDHPDSVSVINSTLFIKQPQNNTDVKAVLTIQTMPTAGRNTKIFLLLFLKMI